MLRSFPGNSSKVEETKTYGIDHPGSTGVIYVMDRAMANGFTYGDPEWGMSILLFCWMIPTNTPLYIAANFGQGAPEGKNLSSSSDDGQYWKEKKTLSSPVGHIDGCADKPTSIELSEASYEYAPTAGITELRTAVADLYNDLYRSEHESKYTYENVT